MAREAFLINPPKKRKIKAKRKRLTTKTKHRPVLYEKSPRVWSRSSKSKSRMRGVKINPFGEEVLLVGANPRRKKRKTSNKVATNPKRRKRRTYRAKRRNPVTANPKRRRKTYRRRRTYRRNPVSSLALNIKKPMTMIMPIAVGIGAKLAVERVPGMVNLVTPLPKFGVQMAVALGGGMLLSKPLGSMNANIWAIVGTVTAVSELLNVYVFKTALAELSEDVYLPGYESTEELEGMSAFPDEVSGIGAYPYEEELAY